jgi:hypothetical protein
MMHGGKRPGAGRPKGSRNRANARLEQFVAHSGPTPRDVLIQIMRHHLQAAEQELAQKKPDNRRVDAALDRAVDAAHKAGPYVHSRMSAVDAKFDISKLTTKEAAIVERILRRAAQRGCAGPTDEDPSAA